MMAFVLLIIALLIFLSIYFWPLLGRLYSVSNLQQRVSRNGELILTYDDGPSETLTPRLLDLLLKYDAKATFFLLGRNAQMHPEIVDRIVREGHQVGCHSFGHLNAWKVWPWRAVRDIEVGYDSLAAWVSQNGMFRPPYGKMTIATSWAIGKRSAKVAWWTIDSRDSWKTAREPSWIIKEILMRRGGIVLMHDGSEQNDFVLKATELVLRSAKQEAIKVGSLADYVQT
jgi:peptidoglycan/xylan/chitin deacetylase (PgdA/CDA1 family)